MPLGLKEKKQQALALLKIGRGKIAKGWVQGVSATTRSGVVVTPSQPCAARWCGLAAILAYDGITGSEARTAAIKALEKQLPEGFDTVPAYNDAVATTQADVLALYDRAIEKLERKR